MRIVFVLFLALVLAGCAKDKVASAKPDKTASTGGSSRKQVIAVTQKKTVPSKDDAKPVITPANENVARVSMVNQNARFVVLTYTEGTPPSAEQQLSLYRNGLKVAEIKVTGPQRDNNTVADIIAGDAQVNDEVGK